MNESRIRYRLGRRSTDPPRYEYPRRQRIRAGSPPERLLQRLHGPATKVQTWSRLGRTVRVRQSIATSALHPLSDLECASEDVRLRFVPKFRRAAPSSRAAIEARGLHPQGTAFARL